MSSKEAIAQVETSTTGDVPGAVIKENMGFVMGSVVKGTARINMLNYESLLQTDFTDYNVYFNNTASPTSQVKKELLWQIKKEAADLGANAVIGIKMETTVQHTSSDGYITAFNMAMYGTAVKFIR